MEAPSPDDAGELCFVGVPYAVGAHESLSFISLINRDSVALSQQGCLLEPGEAESKAPWKEESFQLGPCRQSACLPSPLASQCLAAGHWRTTRRCDVGAGSRGSRIQQRVQGVLALTSLFGFCLVLNMHTMALHACPTRPWPPCALLLAS